eukprot:6695967-Alexandrium_andersonii.AAC.1
MVPAHPAHQPSLDFATSEVPEEGGRSLPWLWLWLLATSPVGRSVGGYSCGRIPVRYQDDLAPRPSSHSRGTRYAMQ